MYTQHPILTEKHRIVDIFADLLKKEKLKYHMVLSIQTLAVTLIYLTQVLSIFLIILEMFLHLHLSPAVFDYTDWT